MGGISDEHVEWAVVDRLKAMLDKPPKTKFNVTQSFALFSSILLWTKNRAWVGGEGIERPHWFDAKDHAARDAREALRSSIICREPWRLSRTAPRIAAVDRAGSPTCEAGEINADFADMSAEAFFKWLRDALAHGDGRTIRPLHRRSTSGSGTWLAGFEVTFPEHRGSKWQLTLSLYHADMRRMGAILADQFCHALGAAELRFEQEPQTVIVREVA